VDSRDGLEGCRFTDFLLDQESDEVSWISLQRIVSDNRLIPFELTLRANDGALKYVEGTVQNMYFFGKPAQFYFLRDISERREMERGLMHTQHQFDRVFNHSLIGIALIDQDFNIERCNSLFSRTFGLSPDCAVFNLLGEPGFFSKIQGRLLPSDSVHFDVSIDFSKMKDMGYLDSCREDAGRVEMIVSPVSIDKDSHGFLVQVQESR
jgi:PAS domain-containing protein